MTLYIRACGESYICVQINKLLCRPLFTRLGSSDGELLLSITQRRHVFERVCSCGLLATLETVDYARWFQSKDARRFVSTHELFLVAILLGLNIFDAGCRSLFVFFLGWR